MKIKSILPIRQDHQTGYQESDLNYRLKSGLLEEENQRREKTVLTNLKPWLPGITIEITGLIEKSN